MSLTHRAVDLGILEGVADLADDDHIRVLAYDVVQGFLKHPVDARIYRTL